MKIVFLGAPGAGKGTFSEMLERDYGLKHISSGDILRAEIKQGTNIGKKVKEMIDAGQLVPDDLITEMMMSRLEGQDNYVLDGFPRTVQQAKDAEKLQIDLVLCLEVSEEVIVARLSGRRLDPETRKIYHLKNIPPPAEILPRLILRDDDKPDVIKKRFKIYEELTAPIIEYYRKKGILQVIDAARKPEEIYENVKEIVTAVKA